MVLPIVPNMPSAPFADQLKDQAQQLGFVLAGITAAAQPRRLQEFYAWLDAGYAGQMHYFSERREAYAHPHHVLEGCRSIMMLALPYAPLEPLSPSGPGTAQYEPAVGKIARYAQGQLDYHDVIHDRLKQLRSWCLSHHPTAAFRGVVDTAPLLERELAQLAGLGWIGKNTLLLNRYWGSAFFLAALLTDLELPVDEPYTRDHCGTCTACLSACPTAAFPQPYVLDASRCISYLTIEHRQDIPTALQDELAGWIFGCDVCQQVCPWNQHGLKLRRDLPFEEAFAPRPELMQLQLLQVLQWTDEQFRELFRRTPLWRSKRRGLLRNAILVAGTQRAPETYETLLRLCDDSEPLIGQAARWAVARFGDRDQ